MPTSNIDKFNEVTGKVLAYLYMNFPIPMVLTPSTLGIEEAPTGIYDPFSGTAIGEVPRSNDEIFFFHSINWLIATGYISANRYTASTQFGQSVLTAKGLEVLKAIPSSLTNSSFGQQLQEAANAGMLDTIKGLTNEVLSRGIGLASSAAIAWVNSSS